MAAACSGALEMSLTVLANPGQNVLMPSPGFGVYKCLAESRGVQMKTYKLVVSMSTTCCSDHQLISLSPPLLPSLPPSLPHSLPPSISLPNSLPPSLPPPPSLSPPFSPALSPSLPPSLLHSLPSTAREGLGGGPSGPGEQD